MKKLYFTLVSLWLALVTLASPTWVGYGYMSAIGHGKGYGYDLGADKGFFIAVGVFWLIAWLGSIVPPIIYLDKRIKLHTPKLRWILPVAIIVLFVIAIPLHGGFYSFIAWFGFGPLKFRV